MKIAVIGSGVSGLSAAWLLSSDHRVTLFEAEARLGGHTNTVDITLDGASAPVDTGFLVHNQRTYPNLVSLFATLGIETVETDMSFSVRLLQEKLEWAGSGLAAVFAQPGNMARPRFWAMLADILRFNRHAPRLLAETANHALSLGDLLERERYGDGFRDWYLLPMGAAIWSSPTTAMLDFPAHAFLHFCSNHGLLQLSNRPRWRTVLGGARTYVDRMAAAIPDVRLHTPVQRITRGTTGVRVLTDRDDEHFDSVIMACHSDQSLAILGDADERERATLAAIRYQPNRAVLHTDPSFLPRQPRAWSAWNFQAGDGHPSERPVTVSYLLNKLQPLPFRRPVLVTLNPYREPSRESTLGTFDYAHPLMDSDARQAQQQLWRIQGRRRTWFAGAWTAYGFHEDGLVSGLRVANALGSVADWQAEKDAA